MRKHWVHHRLEISWHFHFLIQFCFPLAFEHTRPWISAFSFFFEIVACIVWNFIYHWTEKYYFHTSCLIFYNLFTNTQGFFCSFHVSLPIVGCKWSLSDQLYQYSSFINHLIDSKIVRLQSFPFKINFCFFNRCKVINSDIILVVPTAESFKLNTKISTIFINVNK